MLYAYINYPNSRLTIHGCSDCNFIMKQEKVNRRKVLINPKTFSKEIDKFLLKEYRFSSFSSLNDMWLVLDFDDIKFENAILEYLLVILKKSYKPFNKVEFDIHCKI